VSLLVVAGLLGLSFTPALIVKIRRD